MALAASISLAAATPAYFPMPSGWSTAPGTLNDFPDPVLIDPWVYEQRLGLYKTLIARVGPTGPWNGGIWGSVLWGLPLQLGWQRDSGRLNAFPSGRPAGDGMIAPSSWWACMNYYLSIIPFFGAVDAGLFPAHRSIRLAPPPAGSPREKFCISVDSCKQKHPALMANWVAFYRGIVDGGSKHGVSTTDMPPSEDVLLGLLWTAHTGSIHAGLPLFEAENVLLPAPEALFGVGWASLVEIIAATRWAPDFNGTSEQQAALLPPGVMHLPPPLKGLTPEQNRAIEAIRALFKANNETGGAVVRSWSRVMCTPEARVDGRWAIEHILADPLSLLETIIRLTEDFIKYPCSL